jgi:RNA-binding protein
LAFRDPWHFNDADRSWISGGLAPLFLCALPVIRLISLHPAPCPRRISLWARFVVVAPYSPRRKREIIMSEINGKIRRRLRAIAHHIEPVAKIGKGGLNDSVIKAIDKNLEDHELIKVKFVDQKDAKDEACEAIVAATACERVGMVGNIAIFFRQNAEPEKRKIDLSGKSTPDEE